MIKDVERSMAPQQSLTLSHSYTFTLSHSHTLTLSHFHTLTLSHSRTLTPLPSSPTQAHGNIDLLFGEAAMVRLSRSLLSLSLPPCLCLFLSLPFSCARSLSLALFRSPRVIKSEHSRKCLRQVETLTRMKTSQSILQRMGLATRFTADKAEES